MNNSGNFLESDIDFFVDNNDVDGLIGLFLNGDFTTRRKSIMAMKDLDDERAVYSLIKVLHNEGAGMRENAAEALGIIGNDLAIYSLIESLKEEYDEDVRCKCAWSLGKIKDSVAVYPLIKVLREDHNWSVRAQAAHSLGDLDNDLAIEPLIWTLNDRDWHVRKNAVVALGKLNDERAVKPLIKTLNDEDHDVSRRAMVALEKFAGNAVEPLITALKKGDPVTRMSAAEVLGKIGDINAVRPLIYALDSKKKRDKNRYVRAKIAEALGKIGDERAVEVLKKEALDEFIFVRNKAQEALERIRSSGTSNKVLQYNDGEIYFKYPNSWNIKSTHKKKKLVTGKYGESDIKFSINKINETENISLEEFAGTLKKVFIKQKFQITSETNGDVLDEYKLTGENVHETRVTVLSWKIRDIIYYILFKGKTVTFQQLESDIHLIADSFLIFYDA